MCIVERPFTILKFKLTVVFISLCGQVSVGRVESLCPEKDCTANVIKVVNPLQGSVSHVSHAKIYVQSACHPCVVDWFLMAHKSTVCNHVQLLSWFPLQASCGVRRGVQHQALLIQWLSTLLGQKTLSGLALLHCTLTSHRKSPGRRKNFIWIDPYKAQTHLFTNLVLYFSLLRSC